MGTGYSTMTGRLGGVQYRVRSGGYEPDYVNRGAKQKEKLKGSDLMYVTRQGRKDPKSDTDTIQVDTMHLESGGY